MVRLDNFDHGVDVKITLYAVLVGWAQYLTPFSDAQRDSAQI